MAEREIRSAANAIGYWLYKKSYQLSSLVADELARCDVALCELVTGCLNCVFVVKKRQEYVIGRNVL